MCQMNTSDKHVRWNSYEYLYEDLDEHKYGYKDEHSDGHLDEKLDHYLEFF